MFKMRLLMYVLLMMVPVSIGAQEISGVVKDVNGQPLFGATIYEETTDIGTTSDRNGVFRLELSAIGTIKLTVSSVGYNSMVIDTAVSVDEPLDLAILLEEKIFNLPQVVVESVTMTGGLQGVQNSLGSAHYIGQKEIQKFSYTDINRTLRNIPGVNIQEEDGYGLRPNIGLRATGAERSSKITIMEDGILSAPAPYAAPSAYYFPTIGRMEAIEIMKGSSQIKYGPYTTGGAINFLSTPIPLGFAGHADFIAGSDGYRMLHANLGNSHDNVAYLVETMQYSADGFKLLDNGGNTGFNKEDYLAKVRINTDADAAVYQSLTLKVGQARENSNETYMGLTEADFELTPLRRYAGSQLDNITTEHTQISLSHIITPADFIDIHTTAYRNEFSRNWYKIDKVGGAAISTILDNPADYPNEMGQVNGTADADGGLAVKANNRTYYSQGIQTNVILHKNTSSAKHKLDIGLRVHHDQIDRFQWVDDYAIESGVMKLVTAGTPGTESNRVTDARAMATYAQYKIESGKWMISPGLRYEHINISRDDFGTQDVERTGINVKTRSNTVDVFIPGVSVGYKISEVSRLFGGVHKGFAPPGSTEGTNPEESWNYEVGVKAGQNRWSGQLLGYYNDYTNLLGADLAAAGGFGTADLFNGGEATAYGIEAEATYDLLSTGSSRLPLSMAYTYSRAVFDGAFESGFDGWGDVSAGDMLPYVPAHQLAATLSWEHPRLMMDVSAKYASAMLTEAGSLAADTPRTDEAFTVDVSANYKLTSTISAFVNANNITNNVYIVARRPAGVRPNLPRTYNVGLKANF